MGELIPINLEFKESIEQLKTQVDRVKSPMLSLFIEPRMVH